MIILFGHNIYYKYKAARGVASKFGSILRYNHALAIYFLVKKKNKIKSFWIKDLTWGIDV